jgi:hypothetical protein
MKSLLVTLFISFMLLPNGAPSVMKHAHSSAQEEPNLIALSDRTAEYRVSATHVELGIYLADLLDGANRYFNQVLDAAIPEVSVYIVSRDDWGIATNPQVIYGMPHYTQQRVVVAAEDNPFWQANLPRDEDLTEELRQKLMSVYANDDGELSARAFFDLLIIHEICHAWKAVHSVKRQRFWLEEFSCYLLMHTYIAEQRPELLPDLEVLPEIRVAGPSEGLEYTTIRQFEEGY